MTRPPLDVPTLLALLVASEMEAATKARGERMPGAETLHMALWVMRHAIITKLAEGPFRAPAAPQEPDQLELL